jgi:hypothetical protein
VLIDTGRQTLDEAVEHLIGQLTALRYLEPHQAGLRARPKLNAEPKIPLRPPPLDPPPKPILYKAPVKVATSKPSADVRKEARADGRAEARAPSRSDGKGDARTQAKPGLLKSVGGKAGVKEPAPRDQTAEKPGKAGTKSSKATAKPSLVIARKATEKAAEKGADRIADKVPVKLVSKPGSSKTSSGLPSKPAAKVAPQGRTPVKVAPKPKDKSAARVVVAEPKRAAGGRKR